MSFQEHREEYKPSNNRLQKILEEQKSNNVPSMARLAKSTLFSSSSPKSKSLVHSFSNLGNSFTPSPAHDQTFTQSVMEETIETAEEIIRKWDPNSSTYTKIVSLFQHSRNEAKEFMRCVSDLRRAMHFLILQHSHSEKLVLGQNLMQMAVARLEKEFYQILSSNRDQLDPESVSGQSSNGSSGSEPEDDEEYDDDYDELKKAGESITKVEKASALVMSDLLDIEKYKTSQIHRMDWDLLDHMIKNWIKATKVAVTTLFRGEKLLCDHVFSASKTIRESCFYEIINEEAINLFKFPEIVAKGKKSPERIFRLMDLHAAISDLWQDIELIFHFDSVAAVKLQALSSLHKLADSVYHLLTEFESTIHKDSSKALAAGGGIHQLTRSSMTFISSLSGYGCVLSEILAEHHLPRNIQLLESYLGSPISIDEPYHVVSVHLAWLILVLLCKLDTKAELYKDVSLSYLFLANNLKLIVEEVRSTHLTNLLGEGWITRHDKKVRNYAANYETAAWEKVFLTLREKTTTLSPEDAKANFTRFHMAFEEAYMKQSSWIVTDGKLRDELKVSIAGKLVPEYREFYQKYLETLSKEKNLEILVRFKPDDLENYLSDLFHGTPILSGSSSASSSSCASLGCVTR